MKKSVLAVIFSMMLAISGLSVINAQEQPAPQKDTVNMDTDAKPTQYYSIEDDNAASGSKSQLSLGLILGIVAAIVVVGGAVYFFTRKKK